MRALVLHWGRTGGGPRFAVDAVAALEAAGVWTAYSASTHSERAESDRTVGSARLLVPTFSTALGLARVPRALQDGRALHAFVQRNRIDCVFAAMEQLWQPAAAAALRRSGVPYLLGVHDGAFHAGEESRVRAATRRMELAASDGVLTFSRSATETFLETVRFPAERVWTSFLPARAATGAPTAEGPRAAFRFGFFGRILPYKGLGLLMAAVRALQEESGAQRFEVEIWGDGAEAALEPTALPPGVRVVRRWVEEDEIESVLTRFDAVVAPYVDASQSGVIPLAAALGVPALVTPVGGLTEQVVHGRTGLVAADVSAAAFTGVMREALGDPGLVQRLGAAAAERSRSERSVSRFGDDLAITMERLTALGKRRTR